MKKQRFWFLLLALVFLMGTLPVFAAESGVTGSKSAAPTRLVKDQRQTDVTLKLPADEDLYEYDIVFVMDSSSSTKTNNNVDFSEYVEPLLNAVTEKNARVKVGVVKCRGRAFDTIDLATDGTYSGLVEFDKDDQTVQDAIYDGVDYPEASLKALSSGTNMHGGLKMADEMLAADTDVPDSNKFVILCLDGKTYIWNDENDEPTTVYTQYQNRDGAMGTPTIGQSTGAYAKSAYKMQDKNYYDYTVTTESDGSRTVSDTTKCFYFAKYADLYDSDHPDLSDTATKYDYYCTYADRGSTTAGGTLAAPVPVSNATSFTYAIHKNYYEFTPGGTYTHNGETKSWDDLSFLEANPYEIIENADGTLSYDLDSPNPDFYQVRPDSLQKALYLTGHLWTDMGEKYHTGAIVYSTWGSGSGLETAKSFCDWIKGDDISEYAAEIGNEDQVIAMFNSIKEDIIYMVDHGILTDVIPAEFTLVKKGTETFRITVGGESIPATADPTRDNAWNFGTPDEDGVYPYVIVYDEANNLFTCDINVPVESANQLTITYTLELDEDAAYGEHDTNVSATLDYVTSKGETGTYEFEIPVVEYIPQYTVTYTDGVDDEVAFKDQVYPGNFSGDPTPPFDGTPTRDGYKFLGWEPTVADTVTEDVTYTATWEKASPAPAPTPDPDPDPDPTPGTGDPATPGLILAALGISAAAMAALGRKRSR